MISASILDYIDLKSYIQRLGKKNDLIIEIVLKFIFEQLQLSECITKSRRYIREVTGVDGFVDQGKVQADAFSNRFKSENIVSDNPDVQNWMSNITADKKG